MLFFKNLSHPFTLTGYGSVKSTKPVEIILILSLKNILLYGLQPNVNQNYEKWYYKFFITFFNFLFKRKSDFNIGM